MSCGHVIRYALALSVAVGVVLLPNAPLGPLQLSTDEVFAANPCGTGSISHKDQYDGWVDGYDYYTYADEGWGSSASITTRIPAFCNTSGDASIDSIEAFSMVYSTTSPNLDHYAQIGYRLFLDGTTAYYWAEWTYSGCAGEYGTSSNDPNYCDVFGSATSDGAVNQYYEDYDTSCCYGYYYEDMGYNGTIFATTEYDPANSASGTDHWPGPWGHYYAGEAHNQGDEIPGRSPSHAVFSSVAYESSPNSSGAAPPSFSSITWQLNRVHNDTYNDYCYHNDSATKFEIWFASPC
jgi:hypothetical protein